MCLLHANLDGNYNACIRIYGLARAQGVGSSRLRGGKGVQLRNRIIPIILRALIDYMEEGPVNWREVRLPLDQRPVPVP